MLLKFVCKLAVIALVVTGVSADSLYSVAQRNMYTGGRHISVGDVITIFISESTSAVQEAGTQTSGRSTIEAEFDDIWDQIAINTSGDEQLRKQQRYGIRGSNRYDGLGQTTRKSSVKAVLSGIVTQILENGNLYVVGEHKVKVNEETETIQISGVVRPQYITEKNTVFSYQIANLEISLKGSGVVADKQTPGFVSRFFGWLF